MTEAKEAEAKDLPAFQLGKEENPPPSAKNRSKRRLRQAFGATEFGSHPDGRTFCS